MTMGLNGWNQAFAVILSAVLAIPASAQCANDNTLTGAAVTPNCPGTTNVPCVQGGQYTLINVVAGNTYTFSTCGASFDTQITLFNNTGGGALGFNDDNDACGFFSLQSSITWTATFTGQLRVLVDAYPCVSNGTCAPIVITCVAPPAGDCVYTLTLFDEFGDGWGTSFVGYSISGGPYQNYTLPTGYLSGWVQFGVNIGQVVTLYYDASGAWQTDNSYTLSLGGSAVFNSGSPPAAGTTYAATVTCNPPPAPPEDCIGSITICSNQSINNNTNNTGNIADLSLTSAGCLLNTERQGTWYNFTPSAGGQIGFTINPADPLDDYDFALWGPFPPGSTPSTICPPLDVPLRCSYAAPSGPTGLNYSATDQSEDALGDKWVQYLNVTVGQVYLLYISNWSQSGLAFTMNWDLQGGASLDCTQLGVNLLDLSAEDATPDVRVSWLIANSSGIAAFEVERSFAQYPFTGIGVLDGIGVSGVPERFEFLDPTAPVGSINYRIRTVFADGSVDRSPVVTVIHKDHGVGSLLIPNPALTQVAVLCASTMDGTARLELIDPSGRLVQQWSRPVTNGPVRLDLALDGVQPGTYLLRIMLPDGTVLQERLAKGF